MDAQERCRFPFWVRDGRILSCHICKLWGIMRLDYFSGVEQAVVANRETRFHRRQFYRTKYQA